MESDLLQLLSTAPLSFCVTVPDLSVPIIFPEKLNVRFVPAEARTGLLTTEEKTRLKKLHEDNKHFLRIPRR